MLRIGALVLALLGATSSAAASPLPGHPGDTAAAAGTQRLVIPAAAFTPFEDGYNFENHGRYLEHLAGPGGNDANGWYLAPVHLPHGAVVTKMTFYWYDTWMPAPDPLARLQRTHFGHGDLQEMAYADNSGAFYGHGSCYDDTIAYATIDNSEYAYWVVWDFPVVTYTTLYHIRGYNVVIEYTPPATVTGRLSIPAAAFKPYEDGYDYENHGRYLEHYHSPSGGTDSGWYLAPVLLPHGATVTKMTFHWYDNSSSTAGVARLQRTEFDTGNFVEMAYATTCDSIYAFDSSEDNSIAYPAIDNSKYAYWVVWALPVPDVFANKVRGCGVVLEYNKPTTTPLTNYISVPAAAFSPFQRDGYNYENHGRYLKQIVGGLSRGQYEASVYLPQGAMVTKVIFHWKDDWSGEVGYSHLVRFDLTNANNFTDMSTIASSALGVVGFGAQTDTSISVPGVDNSRYGYWLYWDLPSSSGAGQDVWGCGMVVEYTCRVYLPLVLKNK